MKESLMKSKATCLNCKEIKNWKIKIMRAKKINQKMGLNIKLE